MTCVVGITDGSRIVMGADSGSTDPQRRELYVVPMPKVFRAGENGEYLVGFAGSWRLGQVLGFEMQWPEIEGSFDYEFVVKRLLRDLRDCFENQPDYKDTGGFGEQEWLTMIGAKGKIFVVTCKFDVITLSKDYVAIGSGRQVAYGSLSSTERLVLEERIQFALEAASQFITSITAPFLILTSGDGSACRAAC